MAGSAPLVPHRASRSRSAAVKGTIWFVIPAHGRYELTEMCLTVLKEYTCAKLKEGGWRSSAVVVADDENLEIARRLDFATVERDNVPLGRKWNDGYELACKYGEADYVIPLGSDDWIDPRYITAFDMPTDQEIRCHRLTAVVSEDGTRLARLLLTYEGGDGPRIYPARMFRRLGYRPAEEHRARAIDTSTLRRVSRLHGRPRFVYCDLHPLQVVDFKSPEDQLNGYDACLSHQLGGVEEIEPWEALAQHYPPELVERMRQLRGAGVTC